MRKFKINYTALKISEGKKKSIKPDFYEGDFTLDCEYSFDELMTNYSQLKTFISSNVISEYNISASNIEITSVVEIKGEVFKLGLDLHGVINDMPNEMKSLTEAIMKGGGEVHVITGSPTDKSKEELTELKFEEGVHYTSTIGVGDYLESIGTKPIPNELDQYGNPLFSDTDWDTAKGKYCKEHNISLHLDDTMLYGDYFTTPFARLFTKNK